MDDVIVFNGSGIVLVPRNVVSHELCSMMTFKNPTDSTIDNTRSP